MLKTQTSAPLDPRIQFPDFQTMPEYLLNRANHFAQMGKSYFAIDAVSKEKRYYNKFDEESRKIASALYKLGLRKNGCVIYLVQAVPKLHIFLNGVWRANGVCRASYYDDDAATLESRIKETGCSILLCDVGRIDKCKEAIRNVDWNVEILTTEECEGHTSLGDILETDDGSSCPVLEVGGDDPALVLCTSGTTGSPKGAVLNHRTLVIHIHYLSLYPFSEDKPNLLFSSASHYSGSLFIFGLLVTGKQAIITGKITRENLMDTVNELKPGLVFAFPSFTLVLVSPEAKAKGHDYSSVEYIMTGGGTVTPAMKKSLMELPNLKDVIIVYGLSEVGCVTTNAVLLKDIPGYPVYPNTPDFSIGKAYPGISIKIRDVDTLEVLGPRQNGEICIYFPGGHFHSYYKNPEATANSYVDEYMRTGDIGFYDEEGFVYFVDRRKEIFKYYNNHISPSDVENVVCQHPKVAECGVVGVADPGGDVPRAFVTLKDDVKEHDGLAQEIKAFADERLPAYKHLRGGLYILPELPKGKTGKVTRSMLAQIKV